MVFLRGTLLQEYPSLLGCALVTSGRNCVLIDGAEFGLLLSGRKGRR